MPTVKYDAHYAADPAACGTPFGEFTAFCTEAAPGTVLDLGCGQGRDALLFARHGHEVVGVDLSSVGIQQMIESATAEHLGVRGVVADLITFETSDRFDIVLLDRVLHMLPERDRPRVLAKAMQAVADHGHLLVAEGPKGMAPICEVLDERGWTYTLRKRNRVIARHPPTHHAPGDPTGAT